VTKVEPSFVPSRPTVLIDFPAQAAAFARLKPADPRVAERWELYAGGMEIANAFSELTDAGEYRKRFAAAAAERAAAGREAYAVDEDFLREIDGRMPPAGGVALGMDRLVMLLCDECSIERVRAFG
jgi:lysyl-tRNA synthetase class 2